MESMENILKWYIGVNDFKHIRSEFHIFFMFGVSNDQHVFIHSQIGSDFFEGGYAIGWSILFKTTGSEKIGEEEGNRTAPLTSCVKENESNFIMNRQS